MLRPSGMETVITCNGLREIFRELVNDTIIIDRDIFDKPLVEALLQAGLPRRQIILAYAGELVPESV